MINIPFWNATLATHFMSIQDTLKFAEASDKRELVISAQEQAPGGRLTLLPQPGPSGTFLLHRCWCTLCRPSDFCCQKLGNSINSP